MAHHSSTFSKHLIGSHFSRCFSSSGLLSRFSKESLNISNRHGRPPWFTTTQIMTKNPTRIKTILQKYMTQSPSVTPTLLSTDRKMYDFLRFTWNLLNSSWSEYCCVLPHPCWVIYLMLIYSFLFLFLRFKIWDHQLLWYLQWKGTWLLKGY